MRSNMYDDILQDCALQLAECGASIQPIYSFTARESEWRVVDLSAPRFPISASEVPDGDTVSVGGRAVTILDVEQEVYSIGAPGPRVARCLATSSAFGGAPT